jgi:hypothetical protein
MFDQPKCRDVYVVQQWYTRTMIDNYRKGPYRAAVGNFETEPTYRDILEHWGAVKDFELDEYDKAAAYAMDLSMEKKSQAEMVVFDNGEVVKAYQAPRNCADGGLGVDSAAQTQRGTNEYTV